MALSYFKKGGVDVETVAGEALRDDRVLSDLLKGVLSKEDAVRYNSFKVLSTLSEGHPERLYPQWDFFADLLNSDNTYRRLIAVRMIASLTRADTKNKFNRIFDRYYDLLNDSIVVASHLASCSGKIARAKPELQTEITDRLLDINKTDQKHKELVKTGAIEAFDEYFEEAEDREKILEFVKGQVKSRSLKTRKSAREFLKKWCPIAHQSAD